jgi:hypothetical protein
MQSIQLELEKLLPLFSNAIQAASGIAVLEAGFERTEAAGALLNAAGSGAPGPMLDVEGPIREGQLVHGPLLEAEVGEAALGREPPGSLELARLDVEPDDLARGDDLGETGGDRAGPATAVEDAHAGRKVRKQEAELACRRPLRHPLARLLLVAVDVPFLTASRRCHAIPPSCRGSSAEGTLGGRQDSQRTSDQEGEMSQATAAERS